MEFNVEQKGPIAVVRLSGRLTIEDGEPVLVTGLRDLIKENRNQVLLSLRDVGYVDSAGLAALLAGRRLLEESGGTIKLLAPSERVRSILQLRTEIQKAGRQPFRRGRRDAVDLRDLVEQERVQFKFEADAETIARFFESCRQPGRSLIVERVQMQQPDRITDPVVVTGSLVGIAFKGDQG